MDFWDFVAHSEWPAVVGGSLYAFRHELRHVLKNVHLSKVKAAGVEADFEQGIENADRLSKNLSADLGATSEMRATLNVVRAPDEAGQSQSAILEGTYFPPTFIPSVQVTSAWMSLLAYMKTLYDRDGDAHGPRRLKWREPGPIQDLASEFGLTPSEVGALTEMEALNYRIQRAPTPFVTAKEARHYQAVIKRLQNKMRLPETS